MLRNQSERTLAFALFGILAFGAGKHIIKRNIIEPINAKKNRIGEAVKKVETTELDIRRLEVVKHELASMQSVCLPIDPDRAAVFYQERLVQLCRSAGISQAVVSPMQRVESQVGQRVAFSVQAECGTSALANLVGLLETDPIANRITLISLDRIDQKFNRTLLNVEVLAVRSDESFAAPTLPAAPKSSLQSLVLKNDPFFRAYNGPPTPKPLKKQLVSKQPSAKKSVKPPPKIDPRKFIRLIALVEYRGETLAWLVDSRTGTESEYKTNDRIDLDGWSARVVGSEGERLMLEVEGRTQTLNLGAALIDADNGETAHAK